jgi:hypothetical protein
LIVADVTQARIIAAADVAASHLNAGREGGKFAGMVFEAKRSWASKDEDLKLQSGLLVDCVPWRYESSEKTSRDRAGYECSVQVMLRQKFGSEDLDECNRVPNATVDRLATLVEEFDVFFKENPIPGIEPYPDIKWTDSTIVAACSRPDLMKLLFVGIVRVTYSAPKELRVNE